MLVATGGIFSPHNIDFTRVSGNQEVDNGLGIGSRNANLALDCDVPQYHVVDE